MRNFYHTCKFSTLIINFPEVKPRQILDLGKQFNLMIRLENVLKTSLEDVLKMFWRRFPKTSLKRFDDILARHLEDVLKTFLKTSWQDLLKTYGQDENIGLHQDVLKTSLEDVWLWRLYSSWSRRLEDVFWRGRQKTSLRRLQGIVIETNVCWVTFLVALVLVILKVH